MSDPLFDSNRALFAKTTIGQQEIQSRALGLSPITRRLLILIDGKRNFQELATYVAGHNLDALLGELQTKGCIEVVAVLAVATSVATAPQARATNPATPAAAPESNEISKLPDASTRSAKEVDMARHFMMNTINTVFQQNTRLTLLEAIFSCKTVDDVRRVYPKWLETMSASTIGTRRLPEFHKKLFQVL